MRMMASLHTVRRDCISHIITLKIKKSAKPISDDDLTWMVLVIYLLEIHIINSRTLGCPNAKVIAVVNTACRDL